MPLLKVDVSFMVGAFESELVEVAVELVGLVLVELFEGALDEAVGVDEEVDDEGSACFCEEEGLVGEAGVVF